MGDFGSLFFCPHDCPNGRGCHARVPQRLIKVIKRRLRDAVLLVSIGLLGACTTSPITDPRALQQPVETHGAPVPGAEG
jgi:hypothetical protein